jgi:hypothetical protein
MLTTSFSAAQELQLPFARPLPGAGAGEPPPVPGSNDIAVQPRGPIHEAFATPPNAAPQPGPTIAKQPPDPIPEVPPEQRPEGDNVQWIPGYWGWDADRQDFLWVSGLWRVPPDGCKWVPGAWHSAEGGYQWSPGFWAPSGQEEMPYLPQPPVSLDNGPNSPPPNEDSFYTPGCWIYRSSRYLWQPGYWQACRPDMIWMPPSYNWTPNGYLFAPGYWDWPLADRGLLFAPVCFNQPLWNTPGWCYQPDYCVPCNGLLNSLFTGPSGCGYYFGDYFGPSYQRLGFQPWFATGIDNPLFSWYRWHNHNNPGWFNDLRAGYRGRYAGTQTLPPLRTVQPLNQLNGVRLARLNSEQLAAQRNLARSFRSLSATRSAGHNTTRSYPLSNPTTFAPKTQDHRVLHPWDTPHHAPNGLSTSHAPHRSRIAMPHQPLAHPSATVHQPLPAHHTPRAFVNHTASAGHYPAPAEHQPVHHPFPANHAPPAPAHHTTSARNPAPAQHQPVRHPLPAHHTSSAPAHHMVSAHHSAPAAHRPAPPLHHAAPAVHRPAPPAAHRPTPPAQHPAPAAHHPAPAAHHTASGSHHPAPATNHGGGGHGGHHH